MEQAAYLQQGGYPVQFSVDYPGRPLNRLSTAFRVILVVPIAIVLSAVRLQNQDGEQRSAARVPRAKEPFQEPTWADLTRQ